jgi:hypothetical protein
MDLLNGGILGQERIESRQARERGGSGGSGRKEGGFENSSMDLANPDVCVSDTIDSCHVRGSDYE